MVDAPGLLADTDLLRPDAGQVLSFPIVVVGGSTAAYSATLGALQAGGQVCLVLPHRVLGGQFTAQALPASDDAPLMAPKALVPKHLLDPNRLENGELFCLSRSQRAFRDRQRALQPVAGKVIGNPGGSWVSHFSVTPVTAAIALNEGLQPYLKQAQLTIIPHAEPIQVLLEEQVGKYRRLTGVVFQDQQNSHSFTINGTVIIEATDLGDLLELGGIESRVGQEGRLDTGEAILPETPRPLCQQAFTYCAVIEKTVPGAGVSITAPEGYGINPWTNPDEFTGTFWVKGSAHPFFESELGMFRYRRLQRNVADSEVRPGDVTVLNWGTSPVSATGPMGNGNDYCFGALTGVSRAERLQHLKQGRERTQAYLHFLQTQVTTDLKGRGDLTWTQDGIALEPYIREARRGVALTTICHEHVGKRFFPDRVRGYCFPDSAGIGHYHYLDFHPSHAEGHVDLGESGKQCLPFSIALGALIPLRTDGLILSAKSIGTTHITNSAYRMHPIEWAIGEAGGHLAVFALNAGVNLRKVAQDVSLTRQYQGQLAHHGIPIFWFNDLSHDDPDFEAIQVLAAAGIVRTENEQHLNFNPDQEIQRGVVAIALVNALGLELLNSPSVTFTDVPPSHFAFQSVETLSAKSIVHGVGHQKFAPDRPITREHMAILIEKIVPNQLASIFQDIPMDTHALLRRELSRILYRLLPTRMENR
jgi:hypothetical protein